MRPPASGARRRADLWRSTARSTCAGRSGSTARRGRPRAPVRGLGQRLARDRTPHGPSRCSWRPADGTRAGAGVGTRLRRGRSRAWRRSWAWTTTPAALVPRMPRSRPQSARSVRGLRIGRTGAVHRGPGPGDPRAEGDRRGGPPHLPRAGRAVRRARAGRRSACGSRRTPGPRGAALPRVPPARPGAAARGAGPGGVPGRGAAGAPGRGGGRTRGGRPSRHGGAGRRLCRTAGLSRGSGRGRPRRWGSGPSATRMP